MSRSMRSFVTGKTINKQVQLNNRLTTFTTPPITTGDLYVTRDLYVAGDTHLNDLDICGNLVVSKNTYLNYLDVSANVDISQNLTVTGNVYSYGTIKAEKYLPGQVIYMNMFNSSEINHVASINTNHPDRTNAGVCSIVYTPSNNYSNIIIEYQNVCSLPGSTSDTIIFYIKVTDTTTTTILTLQKDYVGDTVYRLPTFMQLNGRYQNSNTTPKTIGIYVNTTSTDDNLIFNQSNSWLKITEIGDNSKKNNILSKKQNNNIITFIIIIILTKQNKMLIDPKAIVDTLAKYNVKIRGVLHIGAHNCEEIPFYLEQLNLTLNNILWLEAIPNKVYAAAEERRIPNVYQALITDKDDEDVIFNIANNDQSSSILEFGTHLQEHPEIIYNNQLHLKSITVNSFFERNGLDGKIYNFWNFDIQGAELMALKGATNYLQYADALYIEVNEKELYKGCGLIGEIDAFLAEYHFERVLTEITGYGWGDALYMKKQEK